MGHVADVGCGVGEGREAVTLEVVVVVRHGVCEAADDSFGDVWRDWVSEMGSLDNGPTFVLWLG